MFFVLLPSNADAAYKIYLKNGSVIKGISHYEKSEGEIKFYFEGGMIGIPEKDIFKIEESEEPVKEIKTTKESPEEVKPVEPEKGVVETKEDRTKETPEQTQPNEIDKKDKEISQKETELKNVAEELRKTMVRIQALYDKSVKGTITSDERSMLQQNMVKKRKLEDDKKRLEAELELLRKEKERLMEGKGR